MLPKRARAGFVLVVSAVGSQRQGWVWRGGWVGGRCTLWKARARLLLGELRRKRQEAEEETYTLERGRGGGAN